MTTQVQAQTPSEASASPRPLVRATGQLPILGASGQFRNDPLQALRKLSLQGDRVEMNMLGTRAVLFSHPDDVREVLVTHGQRYEKNTWGYRRMREILGRGLVTSNGGLWKKQRRTMQPVFQRPRIDLLVQRMSASAMELAENWQKGGARSLDVDDDMMRVTLQIVGHTLLSQDVSATATRMGPVMDELLSGMMVRIARPWTFLMPWTRSNRAYWQSIRALDEIVWPIIRTRRAEEQTSGASKRDPDLLDTLLSARDPETGQGMDEAQLRDEVMTIFLAGHETTAVGLSWALYLMATHPEIQSAAREEVRRVVGDRPIEPNDLVALDLVGRIVQESMRLYPPVWFIARTVIEAHEVGGISMVPGDWAMMSPWTTHRRADVWPDPLKFDPERWSKGRLTTAQQHAYFPFASGSRKCIGDYFALTEAKIILATLLGRFRVEPDGPCPDILPSVTIRPKGGMRLKISPVVA